MPPRSRSKPLTRHAVLTAALEIADADGLAAVSMRSVADRLGVTAMALYAHVGDKEGLLDGLVERINDEVPAPDPEADWRTRLEQLATASHEVALRHPQAYPLLLTRPAVTRGAVRVREAIFSALIEAGVPDEDIPRVERLISTLALGYAVAETTGRFRSGRLPWESSDQLPVDEFPGHHRLAAGLAGKYRSDEFQEAIAAAIELVEGASRQ